MSKKKKVNIAVSIGCLIPVILIAISFATMDLSTDDDYIKFSIIDEEVTDAPIKTQIAQSILIENKDSATEDNLRKLLNYQYNKLSKRKGFKFRSSPNRIYIWAFDSKKLYDKKSGYYKAMISTVDDKPEFKMSPFDNEFLEQVK